MPRNKADDATIRANQDAFYRGVGNFFDAINPFQDRLLPEHRRSSPVRPSSNGPVRPSQPNGQPAMDDGSYTVMGVKYNSATGQAINPDTGKTSPGGYSIDPSSGKRTDYASGADRGAGLGRNEGRVSPTGVQQKGTQTGPASTPIDMNKSFDTLLAEMGLTNYYNGTAFTSNQLPTTNSNPFSANNKGVTATFNPSAPGVTGNSYDNYGADGGAAAASKPLIDGNEEFNPNRERIVGGATGNTSDSQGYKVITPDDPMAAAAFGQDWVDENKGKASSGGTSLRDALSDTASMRRDTEGMRELQARAAFLDADDSMTGLKRAQATRGVVYAGGQHYIASGDGKQAINKDEARGINAGKITPQELLERYKNNISASDSQRPAESNDSTSTPVSGEGRQGLSMIDNENKANTTNSTPNVGTEVDFDNNNGGAPTKFKPPASFKPQYGSNLPANSNVWGG